MEVRDFGQTGLKVSALGFGAGHISGMDEDKAERLLNGVVDAGITLIDTARGYGDSEEMIGKFLSHRRDDFVLSSKCGYSVPGHDDWTGDCVTAGIDLALKTLRTDRIDIMHLHSCERDVLERGEVIEALQKAVDAGKVRVAAYSGENEHRAYALETGAFASIQTSVNICDQRVVDEALPKTRERNMGVIGKRPLANAFWRFEQRPVGHYCEPYWERAAAMDLTPGGVQWGELALRFAAFQPGVHCVISGTSNLEHLKQNIRWIQQGPLPEYLHNRLRQSFKSHDEDWIGQV
ncbi:aldo/keto reductase [bacterium]|nr:aldo/keto reductase [bacterium]